MQKLKLAKEYWDLIGSNVDTPQFRTLDVPDNFLPALFKYTFERRYYEELSAIKNFPYVNIDNKTISWVKINRLPIHPSKIDDYNLLPRWQSVLSSIHNWGHQLIIMLQRVNGKTQLYIGTIPKGFTENKSSSTQLRQAFTGEMPGAELEPLKHDEVVEKIITPLINMKASGAITGIPSSRKDSNNDLFQTLDQLAFGIRDTSGYEHNYSLIIIAEPVQDVEIANLIDKLLEIRSETHDLIKYSTQEGLSGNESMTTNLSANVGIYLSAFLAMLPLGILLGGLGGIAGTAVGPTYGNIGGAAAGLGVAGALGSLGGLSGNIGGGISRSRSTTQSKSVSKEYIDMTAEYCDTLFNKYIKRLEQGRNLGFWNTGIYVLGDTETTVNTVMGILRAVYSGEDTYIEPIRSHLFHPNSGADKFVKQFKLLNYPYDIEKIKKYQELTGDYNGWHPLGRLFQDITTPLNTEELSIASSLPRRDVPGLRFVRNAVRFTTNPPVTDEQSSITIGQVMDTGVSLNIKYILNVNALTKHALITGITGSGKSTTSKTIISSMLKKNIPFLIIEPIKDEYISWAIEKNKHLPDNKKINIYMPGVEEYNGETFNKLLLNPFQPASVENGYINMIPRLERLKAAFIASLPTGDVLPLIIEEALYEHVYRSLGSKYFYHEMKNDENIDYPLIGDLPFTADRLIDTRGYAQEVQSNLKAAIRTRTRALTVGWKGNIFNTKQSTPYNELFNKNTVINLSRITDDKSKSLIMSLLLISLNEYRESQFRFDFNYRNDATNGKLCHLTVIEEAHRVLKNPKIDYYQNGNPEAVAASMFCELLSEIRAYGQGLLIIDQIPSRLIPDAIKNTNLKIVHRLVANDDREAISGCMALRADQADMIATLPEGQVIICGDSDDAASWVKIISDY